MKTLFSFVILFFLSGSAICADKIGPRHSLTLVFESFPPYEFCIPREFDGINIRKIRQVAKSLKMDVKFIQVPWSRALYMANSGEVDGIFSLFKTTERERKLAYPAFPLSKSTDRLYSMSKRGLIKIESLGDLKQYRVGVVSDNSYGKDFDTATLFIKDLSTSHQNQIERLVKGMVDYIVLNESVFNVLLSELKLDPSLFDVHPFIVNRENLYIAFSRKISDHKLLVQQFSKYLAEQGDISIDNIPLNNICRSDSADCCPSP